MSAAGKAQELRALLETIQGKSVVILLSGHPDPDALGSALAHQRICERFGAHVTIAHALPVARPDNRAMVKLLGVALTQVSSARDLEAFDYLSLVDTSTSERSIEIPRGLELLTVVDHHRAARAPSALFVDVRLDVGATASIYAEYLQEGLAPLDGLGRDDARVATALLLGIQTDTDDFALAAAPDFLAAAYLKPRCDAALLSRISHRALAAEIMDTIGVALADLSVTREFALAGVGRVPARSRDAIPTAADFILRREDIDTVIVYGIVEGRIDGSLRTNSPSVDPAVFLEAAFGHDGAGRPYGGGRADKGGFQIPLGMLAETREGDALYRMVRDVVHDRIARVVPDLPRPRPLP